jgi:ATP-binding cassette subfamily B protein
MDRINEIFTTVPEIADGSNSFSTDTTTKPLISIQDLSFTYPEQSYASLKDVSLDIEEGEFVVVVGKTGSGKSTLVKALTRQLPVADGSLFLEGLDYNKLELNKVRERFAYAPQEAFLFSRTLKDNIRFAVPEASDEEVNDIVEQAGLGQDLSGFVDALETIIGERGVTLSGGQRQRTTLARALIKNADVLVLDDTLSAVDNETEAAILESIAERKSQTTILVTHRLAAAGLADRILVLDEGCVIEQGTEKDLLKLNGVYAQLHERQRQRQRYSSNLSEEALV